MATMVNGAIVNGHQRALENQSDRIGLQYMVAAGYDPRQAPAVWKLMAKTNGVPVDQLLLEQSRQRADPAQLFDERAEEQLSGHFDYSPLRVNAEDYSRIKAAVTAANGQKKKIKVT